MANDQENITTQEEFNKWLKNAPAVYQINENEHTKEEWLQEYKEAKISKPEQTYIITNSKDANQAQNATEIYEKAIENLNNNYIAPSSEQKAELAKELTNEQTLEKINNHIKEASKDSETYSYDKALSSAISEEVKSFNEIKENGLEKQRQKDIQAANEEYQAMLNENPYTQEVKSTESKEEISIKIKEMDFSKNPEFAEILKANEEFKGEDLKAFLQTVATMDEAIKAKNDKDLKFSGDSLKLEFSDIDGSKTEINAKLGEGYFNKDLNHLLNLGSNDLSKKEVSKEANDFVKNALEKEPIKEQDLSKANTTEIESVGQKTRFKNPASATSLDNVMNGGVQSAVSLAESFGDEGISNFAKGVSDMYRSVGGILQAPASKSAPVAEKINSLSVEEQLNAINAKNAAQTAQAIKSGKLKNTSKQKEKERTNNKDRGKDI